LYLPLDRQAWRLTPPDVLNEKGIHCENVTSLDLGTALRCQSASSYRPHWARGGEVSPLFLLGNLKREQRSRHKTATFEHRSVLPIRIVTRDIASKAGLRSPASPFQARTPPVCLWRCPASPSPGTLRLAPSLSPCLPFISNAGHLDNPTGGCWGAGGVARGHWGGELGLVPACGTDISPWPGWAIPRL
jgi:hypothetical protein